MILIDIKGLNSGKLGMSIAVEDSVLVERILEFKKLRNAIILSHNYQREEVQDIADLVGDSLELSRAAARTNYDVIVFCGVHFMAESASILSPQKTVLLPVIAAGCPMADMIDVDGPRRLWERVPGMKGKPEYAFPLDFTLRDLKNRYPEVPVVAYVNTSAAVKAESDICCTSANVVKVIESLPGDRVICIPDRNLSAWAAKNTKKEVISWDGFCHVHHRITPEDVRTAKGLHPNAHFIAHPECPIEVLEMADHITSTSGMLRYAKGSTAKEFIIGTEMGLLYRLKKENPVKEFYPLRPDMICPNMKKTTLRTVLTALENLTPVIKVPEVIRVKAKMALDRMLEI